MSRRIDINPLTRIEGHLSVHLETEPETSGEGGAQRFKVEKAFCEGEMFRGFENILVGRDPLDAQQIVQRICGVCPISHGLASIKAQEMAYGIKPNNNGRILQNLILSANYLQSHVIHFYQLSALDFVDVTAVLKYSGNDRKLKEVKAWVESELASNKLFPAAPFLPRWDKVDYIGDVGVNCDLLAHYLQALELRKVAHQAAAVFAAKIPHSTSIVPGGCTQVPTFERILTYKSLFGQVEQFVREVYFNDIVTAAKAYPKYWEVGKGYGDLLCCGLLDMDSAGNRLIPPGVLIGGKWEAFDQSQITEQTGYSRFSSGSNLHPSKGETKPEPKKSGAYTWLKAPRYKGLPMEVGPLARVMVNYHAPGSWIKKELDDVLRPLGVPPEKMFSPLGRHLSRGLEAKWIIKQVYKWLDELDVDGPPAQDFEIPKSGSGFGFVEAPRGALGHWIDIENYLVKNYQCVVPTTWNCSPRDDKGTPGPVEKALEGLVIANPEQPIEAARLVRSFDPCLACAIH